MSRVERRFFVFGIPALCGLLVHGAKACAGTATADSENIPEPAHGEGNSVTQDAVRSTFFATAAVQDSTTVVTESEGDLWPTCWADDDCVYTANGDGRGFGPGPRHDLTVSRITGDPQSGMSGQRLAVGHQVSPIWGDPAHYNRKPTGMVCANGRLYLAVQDLHCGVGEFDDAPRASISWSADHGNTWHATQQPMFTGGEFTTVMFLDFGQDSRDSTEALGRQDGDFVYAYGLDGNWRQSFRQTVADPVDLYLARVPKDAVAQRDRWEFFAGIRGGVPRWSKQLAEREAVLHDTRRQYSTCRNSPPNPRNLSVISQGGIVYVKPLKRYLYTSWTEYTFEFYEAPQPWGPWRLFLTKDFGGYPWFGRGHDLPGPKNGGYGTTIPSKFISQDGCELWVQSNWWVGNYGGKNSYCFSLRKMTLHPFQQRKPENQPDPEADLAVIGKNANPLAKSAHNGHSEYLHDGDFHKSEDSFDQENKTLDFWGVTWSEPYLLNKVVYTTGAVFPDGGWFAADLRVQVRQNFQWLDVPNANVEPRYPYDSSAGPRRTFTITFATLAGDGVRIIGKPGGSAYFTSIAELEVYYHTAV